MSKLFAQMHSAHLIQYLPLQNHFFFGILRIYQFSLNVSLFHVLDMTRFLGLMSMSIQNDDTRIRLMAFKIKFRQSLLEKMFGLCHGIL
jgi:hypothetical protein